MKINTINAELSLFATALGAGVAEPFPERITETAVITSAIHPDTVRAFNAAENDFLLQSTDAAFFESEDSEESSVLQAILPGAKKKKKAHKLCSLVTWRDPSSCRATVIEMMNRSKFKSMTIFDPHGARLATALTVPTRTAAEGSLIALTGAGSAEMSFVRSAVSGGATLNGTLMRGTRLNYLSCMTERSLRKIRKKMAKQMRFTPWLSHTILIPGWKEERSGLDLKKTDFAQALAKIFVRADDKVPVVVASPEKWEAFFEQSHEQVLGREFSDAATAKLMEAPADLATILYHASRIAVAECALQHVRSAQPTTALHLTDEHLATAQRAAQSMLHFDCSIDVLEQRAANAALATASKAVTRERYLQGAKAVLDMIESTDERFISRTKALQLEGVTPAVLDSLVEGKIIKEIQGTDISGSNRRRTSRAYVIASEWKTEDEEAEAEFEATTADYEEDPTCVTEKEIDVATVDITDKAHSSKLAGQGPLVELCALTTSELKALPAILDKRPEQFHWDENRRVVVVRKNNRGEDMVNWDLKLVFSVERWKSRSSDKKAI